MLVVDIDRERLVQRMQQYLDPAISHEEMRRITPSAMEDARRGLTPNLSVIIYINVDFCHRMLSDIVIVLSMYVGYIGNLKTKLLDEKRSEYFPHVFEGNVWL